MDSIILGVFCILNNSMILWVHDFTKNQKCMKRLVSWGWWIWYVFLKAEVLTSVLLSWGFDSLFFYFHYWLVVFLTMEHYCEFSAVNTGDKTGSVWNWCYLICFPGTKQSIKENKNDTRVYYNLTANDLFIELWKMNQPVWNKNISVLICGLMLPLWVASRRFLTAT